MSNYPKEYDRTDKNNNSFWKFLQIFKTNL